MHTDSTQEKIDELKKDYSKTKYNKATNKYLGILRAKISKLNKILQSKKKNKGHGFSVKKNGDATISLVGFPNAGKSSLLNALTGVDSRVADYAFTTVGIIQGMLRLRGANVQLLDTPGLIEGAHVGKGGGTKIASVIRVVDLVVFVVDATAYKNLYTIIDELEQLGMSFGYGKELAQIEAVDRGGIRINNRGAEIDDAEVLTVLNGLGIYNANITLFKDCTIGDLIDKAASNRTMMRGMIALNKIDMLSGFKEAVSEIEKKTKMDVVPISAKSGAGLEKLKETMFMNLGLIRIYLKEKGGVADRDNPLILHKGATIEDAVSKLHSEMAEEAKHAYVTGPSARFANQRMGMTHVLDDGDTVTFA